MKNSTKRNLAIGAAVLALSGCATTKDDKIDLYTPAPIVQEEAIKLSPVTDLEQIVSPDRKFEWNSGWHTEGSVLKYNSDLKTLDTGLRNGDLVIVLYNDGNPIVASEALVKFYSSIKDIHSDFNNPQSTIRYKIDGEWVETSPRFPEYNLNLNSGVKGGVYRTVDDLIEWPEDPFAAIGFHPKK